MILVKKILNLNQGPRSFTLPCIFQSHLLTWIMKPAGVEQKSGECDKGGKATQQRPEN